MKQILNKSVFSMTMAGVYFLLIGFAIAAATFIENDFGTASAQKVVYKSWWFELIILLFCLTLIWNIFRFKLYRWSKIPVFLFHFSGILIIVGAGITRYISYEGLMPIREGSSSNVIYSDQTYLSVVMEDESSMYTEDFKVLFGSLGKNRFNKTLDFKDRKVNIELLEFYPNAVYELEKADSGPAYFTLNYGGMRGMEKAYLAEAKILNIGGLNFGFNTLGEIDVDLRYVGDSILLQSRLPFKTLSMDTQETDSLPAEVWFPVETRKLYTFKDETAIVFGEFLPKGKLVPVSQSRKTESSGMNAVKLKVTAGDDSHEVVLMGNKGMIGEDKDLRLGDYSISLSYGSRLIQLPFEIKLKDFQLERYPGSNSASSYASEVMLIDEEKDIYMDYRIYMNHVLNHRGFRFFQSSYDQDELGTILSVNHDYWGTFLTYVGYFILALGMLLTVFAKRTRLRKLSQKISEYRKQRIGLAVFILLSLFSQGVFGQKTMTSDKVIPEAHAEKFGRILVQDQMGRKKPVNTLSGELLRKLYGKDEYDGQNSDQVLLSMTINPEAWADKPMIKIGHEELKVMLKTEKFASFNDFFNKEDGSYILGKYIEEANRTPAATQTKFQKDVIKVDERVSIMYMIFNGNLLKIFPKQGDTNNKWYTPVEAAGIDFGEEPNLLVHNFMQWYIGNINKAFESKDWKDADLSLEGLDAYQRAFGKDLIPAESKIKAELLYNKINIFGKLISWYGLVGFILLIFLIIQVFKPTINLRWPVNIGIALIILGFIAHTFGLGLRWHISGHAPWSNGYESVIYISWATVLAGLIYARKSPISLAATSIMGAWILIVSMMSWADPQITNLVPVLKSYWLTIHVSVIAASYGFFAIASLIALINLLLMILRNKKSGSDRVILTIRELSAVIESALIIGLFLLTIGTFLGGVWANESWGRYWGWDAKESWSMVSIMVYSFIAHMRMIPSMKSLFAFNFAAFIGFATILMTYFGVNFYLSGLHSYAAGDPVPIPTWVFVTTIVAILIGFFAWLRQNPEDKMS
ncbi:MAG TPA: cytochrome C biogenesis protein [Saprospirales bacterium]|nr:cytochrome C biogenesis protein [Saprospirales bacterium]HRQ30053.1 cytochrome c biogenesis protein CcsA [Saprospiraceae bacterium]